MSEPIDARDRVKLALARKFATNPDKLKAAQSAVANTGATAEMIASATTQHLDGFKAHGITTDAPGGRPRSGALLGGHRGGAPTPTVTDGRPRSDAFSEGSDGPSGRPRSDAMSEGSDRPSGRARSNAVSEGASSTVADIRRAAETTRHLIEGIRVKAEVCASMQAATGEFAGYEFMQQSPSAQATLFNVSRALSGMAGDLGKAATGAQQLLEQLEATDTKDEQAAQRTLTQFKKDNAAVQKALEDAAGTATKVSGDMQTRVEEQALYNYFKAHPSDARKALAVAEKVASVGMAVGAEFIPPGWKWTANVAKLVIKAASRAIEEGLVASEQGDYVDSVLAPGEIFAQFDKNPATMAAGLAATMKSNVKILMAGIDIACGEVPMWGVVSSVVETIVTNIIDARVNEASSRLATCKTKAEAASAYTENVDGAAKQVKDALWEKLTDPETWGGATALLKSVAEKAEDVTENATDLAAGLATIVVGPITERILKAFPPNPAQLVTGQELVGALNAIQRAAVPAQFRGGAGKVGGPSASSLRTQIDPDELPQTGPNGAHIVDSDESRTVRGSDGTAHYVAFRCGGLKVWGYLNAVGIWMPERVDEEEMVADAGKWLGRRITADGYREGGNLVKGKWHKPWRDHSAYVLRRDDGILEAAGAPQATEAGGDFRNSVGGLLEGRAAGPGADFIVPNA